MAADPAHEAADAEIGRLSKEIHREYAKAAKEMRRELERGLRGFSEGCDGWERRIAAGEATREGYRAWRQSMAARLDWQQAMVGRITEELHRCGQAAAQHVNKALPDVYAENYNYAGWQVESTGVDTGFALVDRDAVVAMVDGGRAILPEVNPNDAKARAWGSRKVRSALTQSVIRGESMPHAAARLMTVCAMDERAANRAARTAITGAENGGRVDCYRRDRDMGIDVRMRWMATLDSRTRPSHRALDGKVIGVDGRFPNGCRYPGDPQGPAWEVWNCRCTLVPDLEGYDAMASGRHDKGLEGISYEDWKAGKNPPEPKQGSGRSLKAFISEPSVRRRLAKHGMTEAQARKAIREELAKEGRDGRSFPSLTKGEQRRVLTAALDGASSRRADALSKVKSVDDARAFLKSGLQPLAIKGGNQRQHIPGTTDNAKRRESDKDRHAVPSEFNEGVTIEEMSKWVSERSGSGSIKVVAHEGKPPQITETFEVPGGKIIGTYRLCKDDEIKFEGPTSMVKVHYSKDGVHVVPAAPRGRR